jgi:hypothetical protein
VVIGPDVESFDEETHTCKPTDTFQTISQEKYHSDRYAAALLMFNRGHPLAADGVRSEPPVLRPGQPVFIPPVEILQKRYSALITDPGPLARPPAHAPGHTIPGPARVNPISERTYQVQGRPETFIEIAKKVFSNPNRWWDIAQLNPQHKNPNEPLAVNTVIRLPVQ